jgi:hypothetical protein
MPEITGKTSTRLEPSTTWTVVTDSPLKGLSFAREAGAILAWDEGNQLYLLNTRGLPDTHTPPHSRVARHPHSQRLGVQVTHTPSDWR